MTPPIWLVTGGAGFSGRLFLEYLARRPEEPVIVATDLRPPDRLPPTVTWRGVDLLDQVPLRELLAEVRPDRVIHLAGLNQGPLPRLLEVNVVATRNLLQELVPYRDTVRVLLVSSAAVYGASGPAPIPETAPLAPVNDYGVAKAAQELLAHTFELAASLQLVLVRPFNLVGPGLPPALVCGNLVRQVVELERGQRTSLELFDLTTRRDFVDIRDVIRAYWGLLEQPDCWATGAGRCYNLGSGQAVAVGELVARLEQLSGRPLPVTLPMVARPALIPTQRADCRLMRATLGWEPAIPLVRSLADMLVHAREVAPRSGGGGGVA